MKIMCFLPADYNLAPLIKTGITEYYFGYTPPFWQKKYTKINSINRRYEQKVQTESLENVMKLLQLTPKSLYVVLNGEEIA